MQRRAGGEAVLEATGEIAGKTTLVRAKRGEIPFLAIHVVNRNECRLAAHRQANVALEKVLIDLVAERLDLLPLLIGVGLGDARGLDDALDRHREVKFDLGFLNGAADGRGRAGLGRAGKGDVAFAGDKARGRIEPDPARAGQIHLGPGMKIGEIIGRPHRSIDSLHIRRELDEVA